MTETAHPTTKEKESAMGLNTAHFLSDLDMSLESQVELHLTNNCYPSVPLIMVKPCADAIRAGWDEDPERIITMPDGVAYKNEFCDAPAWALIDNFRLQAWL